MLCIMHILSNHFFKDKKSLRFYIKVFLNLTAITRLRKTYVQELRTIQITNQWQRHKRRFTKKSANVAAPFLYFAILSWHMS